MQHDEIRDITFTQIQRERTKKEMGTCTNKKYRQPSPEDNDRTKKENERKNKKIQKEKKEGTKEER